MDEILRQLALEAQQHPAGSQERQIALTKLIDQIYRHNRLTRPYIDPRLSHLYEDIYSEARLKIVEHICQNIDTYDSQRPVMAWVNQFFNFRFKDVRDRYMNHIRYQHFSIDALEKLSSPKDIERVQELSNQDPMSNLWMRLKCYVN